MTLSIIQRFVWWYTGEVAEFVIEDYDGLHDAIASVVVGLFVVLGMFVSSNYAWTIGYEFTAAALFAGACLFSIYLLISIGALVAYLRYEWWPTPDAIGPEEVAP